MQAAEAARSALACQSRCPERCIRLAHGKAGHADALFPRQDDPDLQPMLADIQKNGMGALMKYWNDPTWLSKVGGKLGDVTAATAAAQGAAAPAQAPRIGPAAPPEVNTLFDAAKCAPWLLECWASLICWL